MIKTFYIHDIITNITTGEELRYIIGRDNYIYEEGEEKYLTGYKRRYAAVKYMHAAAAGRTKVIKDEGDAFIYVEGGTWIHNCSIKEKYEEEDK